MHSKIGRILFFCLLAALFVAPISAHAASQGTENMAKIEQFVKQALQAAEQGNPSDAKQFYDQYHDGWLKIEDSVKTDSSQAYSVIESNMGQVDYAFLQNKQPDMINALKQLDSVDQNYIQGKYNSGDSFKKQNLSLSDFVALIQQTKENVQNHDQQSSLESINKLRQSWLSVEGTVVAQSSTVYNNTERDLVTVNAMISNGDYQGAAQTLYQMSGYLTPLAGKSAYTVWDAAMIPIREGLEGLLVVAALLAFIKKSNNGNGKGWIWSGVLAGVALSCTVAIIVKFVFSSGAFGQNNFLISGWTGVIAAIMLLYMSYWLHSKSNISEWNKYIRNKSQSALDTGRIISLGALSFLAVFREGTETVLFIIGMVNQISFQQLILGLLIGVGILAVIAYLMLFVGVKLPMRPFFLVSSLIVFYLCIKFTGLGIHSLQLAGFIPSTVSANLPSIEFLGFYPSWQSAIPQIVLLLSAILIFIWQKSRTIHQHVPDNK